MFLMAGGSAAGKSTTSKAFAVGEPEEFHEKLAVPTRKGIEEKWVHWTLYDNCALAGNHKSGTDANTGPGATKAAFLRCIELSDIIIVDGKINSPQWVEMVNDMASMYEVEMCVLYFDLEAETLLQRLAIRRGVEKESIRDSMYQKCQEATGRADLLVRNVQKLAYVPYSVIMIKDRTSTEEIVDMMDNSVCEFFGDC